MSSQGLGFGVWLSQASKVTDRMVLRAAMVLADFVSEDEIADGRIYPNISRICDISTNIAAAVFEVAHQEGVAQTPFPEGDLRTWIRKQMYIPEYVA